MNEIFIIIGVVVILLLVFTLLLFYISKRVNLLIKKIFVDRLQEFDFLIEDKEKKINELNGEISNRKEQIEELKSKTVKRKADIEDNNKEVVLPVFADLEDDNVKTIYRKIKYGFNYDVETAIKKLVKSNHENNSKQLYNEYRKIRSYFSFNVIYKISTFQSNEQFVIVNELLSDIEKERVKNILVKKNFNINKFVEKVEELIIKSNPKIKVLVGDKSKSYNDIDEYVETVYSDKITEGFKIEYKGVVFDYSI